MRENLILLGRTRALVDDFGEIIYVGSCTWIVAFVCSSFYQGMMMFIFGWGNRPILVERGVFPCPICKTTTDSIHLRHRRWITFFFVPAIPISSSYETVACQKCKSSFPIEAIRGETPSQPTSTRVSLSATVAMLGSIFALLTFCIYSMSFGLALVSVILGHTALKEIKRDRPAYEGRRRAITALAIGYPAMLLALVVGFNAITQKRKSSGDLTRAIESGVEQEENFDTKEFSKETLAIWLPSTGDQARATDGKKLISFSLRDAVVSESRPVEFKSPRNACFSSSGKRLVLADSKTLSLSDLSLGNDDKKIELPKGQTVHALEFHPNERWIAVGMRGKVGIADFDKAQWIAFATSDSIQYMSNIRFSSDGRFLIAGAQTAQESTRIYQLVDNPQL